jgi:hypothetical protein
VWVEVFPSEKWRSWFLYFSAVETSYHTTRNSLGRCYHAPQHWRWRRYGLPPYYMTKWPENHNFYTFTCLQTGTLSSVGIALGYGLDDRGSSVRFLGGSGNFSPHHRVQNGSGTHPASYPMGTRGSFLGGKAAGGWSWPLTSFYGRGQECVELYLHSPDMSSWRGA